MKKMYKSIYVLMCIVAVIFFVASCDSSNDTSDSLPVSNESVVDSVPPSNEDINNTVNSSIQDTQTSAKQYSLTVIDEVNLLANELKSYYAEGEEIVLEVTGAIDVDINVEMNEGEETPVSYTTTENHRDIIVYKMPAKDSVLRIYSVPQPPTPYEQGLSYLVVIDKMQEWGELDALDKNSLEKYYPFGEEITVRTINPESHCRGNFKLVLNKSEEIPGKRVYDENGNYLYNEWTFVMPQGDASSIELDFADVPLSETMKWLAAKSAPAFQNKLLSSYYPIGHEITLKSIEQIGECEMVVKLNGEELSGRERITDENGNFLYYQWKLIIPDASELILTAEY